MNQQLKRVFRSKKTTLSLVVALLTSGPAFGDSLFTAGNLVVSVEGNGVFGATSGSYSDNQAAPLTPVQTARNNRRRHLCEIARASPDGNRRQLCRIR